MALQTEIRHLFDCHLVGSDGQSIGQVGQVYLNDRTGDPEWVTVRTGMFGMKETFVPLAGSHRSGDEIRVPFDKDKIKDAPNIDVDGHLSIEEEARLYRHYGLQPPSVPAQRSMSPTGEGRTTTEGRAGDVPGPAKPTMPAGPARGTTPTASTTPTAPTTPTKPGMPATGGMERPGGMGRPEDIADREIDMTMSEEQLRIGKETVESGRVRLRKYVETETVQESVPLSHEEIVIEREPIREGEMAAGTYEIGEDEQSMTLHEERAVIGKETRPVERVHARKQSVEHEETVSGTVRKEHLEIDEEGITRDRDRSGKRDEDLPPL
ncbi:Stress response protein YsnF [Nonomuraea coxensis DSM 45129]|uniref:Stress response protein YsnF n=1 Tax=Nonomuraea coxensis DSM 45129 TaxID=1122611 RepID=A0ABX8U8M0_9ACTN|nr:PRC and DUF2382 domain-containing protein [Nonomuraea coxensis]QYC44132.1 Stress response protein YsnF [Nonomuraea coxensis DSM 45129]